MSEQATRRDFVKGSAVALGAAAVAGTANVALADAAAASYTPGTYTGTAESVGTVTVTMTFDETSITDVAVDVSGETVFLGRQMQMPMESAIMEAQGADVDVIAGCTMTCTAVKRAAASCIAQAKGEPAVEVVFPDNGTAEDWLGTAPEIDEAQIVETWDTDILIVGAGAGGLMAAVYAQQNGLDFRLIEQNPFVQDTRGWYGAIDSVAAQEAGSTVDRRKLLSEISRYASGKCDQRVVKTWIDESAAMHDVVASVMSAEPYNYECQFTSGEEARWPENCAEENTVYLYPEQEHFWTGDIRRNVVFQQYLESNGFAIDFNTAMVELTKDGERVSGAIAQNREDGTFIRINAAKGVLLACGGYPGNPYMMQALDPLAVKVTTADSFSPFDRGQGIRAAIWAGAVLDDEAAPMLFDRGIVAPGVNSGYIENPAAFGGVEFAGTVKQYNPGTQPFLKVNRNGERFANESSPYNDISYASIHQNGGVYAQICDANYYEDVQRFHTIGCSAGSRQEGAMEGMLAEQIAAGLAFEADTLEELADKLGFAGEAKDNFLATVERYNEMYDNQYDEDFGKCSCRLSEIRTAPFYGCWLGASLLTTEQGIAINEKTQALDADRNPIEGLYITGDMSGSFFANNYPCLMAGLACGRTLTLAIKAIKQMEGLE